MTEVKYLIFSIILLFLDIHTCKFSELRWVIQRCKDKHFSPTKKIFEIKILEYPTSTPSSSTFTDNKNITRLISAIGKEQRSVVDMMKLVGLKDRKNFLEYSLNPSIAEGLVCMLYPESPRHPRQKYLLTEKGPPLRAQNTLTIFKFKTK